MPKFEGPPNTDGFPEFPDSFEDIPEETEENLKKKREEEVDPAFNDKEYED